VRTPDRINDHVGTASTGHALNRFCPAFIAIIDRLVRTMCARQCAFVLAARGRDDASSQMSRNLHCRNPHPTTRCEHEHGFSWFELGAFGQGNHSGGVDHRQGRSLFQREARRRSQSHVAANGDKFRQTANHHLARYPFADGNA
jgi:hypothetical protein